MSSSSKEPESSPGAIPYVGFCRSRNEFCADVRPTVPGASPWSMDVLSSTMCQFPRFCSKAVALPNMSPMEVAEETSQELRGWLKEVAW